MRIGIMASATSIDALVEQARRVEVAGLDNLWLANIFGVDAVSALMLMGYETRRIGLGTAVTPTYPRHPTALAQQALTAAAATGNRLSLGIGLSHKVVIENMLGFSYAHPAAHMREYLSVLVPLLEGESVTFKGEHYNVNNVQFRVPGAERVPVIVAALGPVMLKLAGELADGTTTWMVGPKTMGEHIVPRIRAAAQIGGRPEPTIVGAFPIVLTNKPDEARETIGKSLAMYGTLPSYRAMLDREGVAGPGDIAIAGDENALRGEIKRLEDIGVTDFNASIMPVEEGAGDRTLEFLSSLKA